MKVRYIGSDEARDLAVAGGLIHCERGKWVDVATVAAETGIAAHHAEIVARDIVNQPDWESDAKKSKTDDEEKS